MQMESGLPVLDQFAEEGFVDCVFKIEALRADDRHYHFRMLALYEGQTVGMGARLVKTIGPGFNADMKLVPEHVYREGLVLFSLGELSDRLIGALAKLYGIEPFQRSAAAQETYTAIALQQADTELELHPVRIKIFGRDQDDAMLEEQYYESFFNVDLPAGFVYWNEKDEAYREPLLRAWTAG